MALQTQGFRAETPPLPQFPSNLGKVDIGSIYDAVVKGLSTADALRSTLGRQGVTDAEQGAARKVALAKQEVIPSQTEAEIAQNTRSTALASPDIVAAESAKALAGLDADLVAEQNRRTQQRALAALSGPQQIVAAKNGFPLATNVVTERLPDGRVRTVSTESANVGGETVPIKTGTTEGLFAMMPGIPSNVRGFEMMTSGLNPDQIAQARGVALGITPRPSSAAISYKEVVGSDGITRLVAVDPRAVGAQVVGSGQLYGSGVGGIPAPGTAAVTPQNAEVFASPTIAEAETQKSTAQEQAKLQADRQAKLPKARAAVNSMEQKTKLVEDAIERAKALTSNFSVGYGSFADRLPMTDARALAAELQTIKSNLGFDTLQEMRQSSPTGGALGNVSDFEGKLLQSTISALDTGLSPEEFIAALDRVKEQRARSLNNIRQNYQTDFQLAAEGGLPAAPFAAGGALVQPNAVQSTPTFNTIEEANAAHAAGKLPLGTKVIIGGQSGKYE